MQGVCQKGTHSATRFLKPALGDLLDTSEVPPKARVPCFSGGPSMITVACEGDERQRKKVVRTVQSGRLEAGESGLP
jgi:hypothetical protein